MLPAVGAAATLALPALRPTGAGEPRRDPRATPARAITLVAAVGALLHALARDPDLPALLLGAAGGVLAAALRMPAAPT